jgi:biopolymer transport protein ExbD
MRIKKPESSAMDIDMTPMIDVVFQLLTFFMLISNFEQTQADERVKLARDRLAQPPKVARKNNLTINVGYNRSESGAVIPEADGTPGRPLVFFIGQAIPIPQFAVNFQQEARLHEQEGLKVEDVTVVLRADKEVPTGLVQELIKQAQEAGFSKFAISATQQNE